MSHAKRAERRIEISNAVSGGEGIAEAAKRFGVCIGTVISACKENGGDSERKNKSKFPDAVLLVKTGRDVGQVAEEFNLSESRLRTECRYAGLKLTRKEHVRTKLSKFQMVTAEEWQTVDWSLQDTIICRALGVSRERVRQVRVKFGKPKAEFHHQVAGGREFRQWVLANRESLDGMTARQILDASKTALTVFTAKIILKNMGVIREGKRAMADILTLENLPSFVALRQFRDGMSECWEWRLPQKSAGYPRFGTAYVHHLVFHLAHGDVPVDRPLVLHRCDNRKCANPEHLYAGTHQDNADDRGRNGNFFVGKRFTDAEAIEIRKRFDVGGEANSVAALSEEMGCSFSSMWKIVKRRSYSTESKNPSPSTEQKLDAIRKLSRQFRARDLSPFLNCTSEQASQTLCALRKKGFVKIIEQRRGTVGATYELVPVKQKQSA